MTYYNEPLGKQEISERKYALQSNFHGLPIHVSETVSPGTNRLVIATHGSFGSMECFENILDLTRRGDASVVRLSTARREELYRGNDFIGAFTGKTFRDECEDVRKVIANVLAHKSALVRDPEHAEVALLGLSLGGTIATLLAHQFHDIRKLFLVSAGCRTKNRGLPMLNTYGKAETVQIKRAASAFTGSVLHIGPAEDPVVPRAYQDELFAAFPEGSKERLIISDADHVLSNHRWELLAAIQKALRKSYQSASSGKKGL